MKKKIAIWCCLAVVLAIFVYFFINHLLTLSEWIRAFQDILEERLFVGTNIYNLYIEYFFSTTILFIGIILTLLIMYFVSTFKDMTAEEIKKQLLEKQKLHESKKQEKKEKEIDKLNKKLKKLKED